MKPLCPVRFIIFVYMLSLIAGVWYIAGAVS